MTENIKFGHNIRATKAITAGYIINLLQAFSNEQAKQNDKIKYLEFGKESTYGSQSITYYDKEKSMLSGRVYFKNNAELIEFVRGFLYAKGSHLV